MHAMEIIDTPQTVPVPACITASTFRETPHPTIVSDALPDAHPATQKMENVRVV